jgi:uncharacterized protein YbjQ (UPF0145 family)
MAMPGNTQVSGRASVTSLSGNEIYCMAKKGIVPIGVAVGNSVQSMGFLGSLGASFRGAIGGEVPQVTKVIEDGRRLAFKRMLDEAARRASTGYDIFNRLGTRPWAGWWAMPRHMARTRWWASA